MAEDAVTVQKRIGMGILSSQSDWKITDKNLRYETFQFSSSPGDGQLCEKVKIS
jgi:hypothetical protein